MAALNLTGYHLTFDDEFGSFLPTELGGPTWDVTIFNGSDIWGQENYDDGPDGGLIAYLNAGGVNPFRSTNGVLSINATPNRPGATSSYTTGLISNGGVFSQTYGYFEMRAELPTGPGFWPGFWMLPSVDDNDGLPEIDAMEAFGARNGAYGGSNQVHYDVHSGTNFDQTGAWATVPANIYTSYNTYGVMWTPTTLTFYFDGQSIGSLRTTADLVANPGEYLLASLLTGAPGDWPGPMAGETGSLKIDYIRAFSSNSAIPAVARQAFSSPDGGGTNLYGATTANGNKAKPTVTISSGSGTPPITVNLTGSVTSSGDKFSVAGSGIISATLGATAQTLSFHNAPGVTVIGGSGYDTISVDGGTNNFTAGSGGMTIASSTGTNTFHLLMGAGQMTVEDFTTTDKIAAPLSPKGHNKEYSVNGGSLVTIVVGQSSMNAIYLPHSPHFNMSAIEY